MVGIAAAHARGQRRCLPRESERQGGALYARAGLQGLASALGSSFDARCRVAQTRCAKSEALEWLPSTGRASRGPTGTYRPGREIVAWQWKQSGPVTCSAPMNDTSSAPRVRTLEPFRGQGIIRFEMPEDTLPTAHRARLLWRVVETLELSAFTAAARAVEGRQGRAVLSVRMQLTLLGCPGLPIALAAHEESRGTEVPAQARIGMRASRDRHVKPALECNVLALGGLARTSRCPGLPRAPRAHRRPGAWSLRSVLPS